MEAFCVSHGDPRWASNPRTVKLSLQGFLRLFTGELCGLSGIKVGMHGKSALVMSLMSSSFTSQQIRIPFLSCELAIKFSSDTKALVVDSSQM